MGAGGGGGKVEGGTHIHWKKRYTVVSEKRNHIAHDLDDYALYT